MEPAINSNTTRPISFRPARALRWPLRLSAALWLSLSGCEATPAQQAASPASSLDAGVPGETIMSVQRGLEAHAIDLGSDHLHVELRQPDGRTAFAVDFQPDGAHYRVTDALYAAGDSAALPAPRREERLLPRDPDQLLTLKTAVEGTLFLHESLLSATSGNYAAQDHYGCDLGPLGRKSSCSDVGACCDLHDQCYAENHCTAASWGEQVDSACQAKCNLAALSCVLLQTPKPGKSSCCDKSADFCGQYRVAGQPKPTSATAPNAARWDGVEQWNGATGTSAKPSAQSPTASKPKSPTASKPKSPTASKPKSPTASKPTQPTSTASKPSSDAGTNASPAKKPRDERATTTVKPDAGVGALDDDDDDCDDDDDDDDDDDECDADHGACDPDSDPFCDEEEDDDDDDDDDEQEDDDDDEDDEDDYSRVVG